MKSKAFKLFLPIALIFFILFTSCILNGDQNTLNYANDYLLILNSTGNNIIAYDLTFNKFIDKPIAVGPSENTNYAPQQMISSEDGNYIYIINSLDNSVSKFTKNLYYIERYSLPAGTNPYNAFIDGSYMYITGYLSGKVIKLNLDDGNYMESQQLYTTNSGIQAIAKLNSQYIIAINTNLDLSTYQFQAGIIYILNSTTLEKVKEFELDSTFIGLALTNFQQIYPHSETDGLYCDLISTGSYGGQDSGFLRIKIDESSLNITKISADALPAGEYFGSSSSLYQNFIYIISNKAIYKVPVNNSSLTFSTGIEKNQNVSGKTNLSLIYVGELINGTFLAIVDSPGGTPNSFSTSLFSDSFLDISFTKFYEFSGYPVSIIFRKGQD